MASIFETFILSFFQPDKEMKEITEDSTNDQPNDGKTSKPPEDPANLVSQENQSDKIPKDKT